MAQFFAPKDVVHRQRNGKRERLAIAAAPVPLSVSVYFVNPLDAPSSGSSATQLGIQGKYPTSAVIQVLTAAINFTIDGTTVTNANGFLAQPGDMIYLNTIMEIQKFQAIENVGAAAIEVLYQYGY